MVRKVEPFYDCPRYKKCSVNNCPLDPAYPNSVTDEADPEQKCTIAKNIRSRIAAKYPGTLKFEGLTPREFTATKNWESLPEEEKDKKREAIKNVRSKINAFSSEPESEKLNV
ncbi:hypothetical protein [Methanosarcina mazei]|uniref:Uncharacterized protein n=1 Tax=Methanosarcina mazei S-6 TaxID=213585 RepID=A0A0E3RKM2_METMZ|nr:hypothetical protein [Methanosarcina mazei]AKB64938.1 hypothetical protein MSMAS_1742 [Methanosarcina mazei S-6]